MNRVEAGLASSTYVVPWRISPPVGLKELALMI
jgi:hypothetical protein